MSDGFCSNCTLPMPHWKRPDALYCTGKCKEQARRKRNTAGYGKTKKPVRDGGRDRDALVGLRPERAAPAS